MTSSVNIQYGETVLYPEIPDTATVSQLKESIDETWGYAIQKQELHFLGLPIEDEDTTISEFLQLGFGSSFSLILKEDEKLFWNKKPAREFSTDKTLFLICGARYSFETILLESGQSEWKKLKPKMFGNMERFGIAEYCEGEDGKRCFKARIYEVKDTGSIRFQAEGKGFKAFLTTDDGKDRKIEPVDTKVYDEKKIKDPKNKTQIFVDILKAIGNFAVGVGGIVSGVGGVANLVSGETKN